MVNRRGKPAVEGSLKRKGKKQQSLAALCQTYSIDGTRLLIDRMLDTNPKTRLSDGDLIKVVEIINSRAFGKPVARKEVDVETTVDIRVQHLDALKNLATERLKVIEGKDTAKQSFADAKDLPPSNARALTLEHAAPAATSDPGQAQDVVVEGSKQGGEAA